MIEQFYLTHRSDRNMYFTPSQSGPGSNDKNGYFTFSKAHQ